MQPRDSYINDNSFQRLLHNQDYYQSIFKKTEKIISVVFYILNNIVVDKRSETHTSNLAAKAHFAHEHALRSLEVKSSNAHEVLEQFAQALIGLESTVHVVTAAGVLTREVEGVVVTEITAVLRGLNDYLEKGESFPSALFMTETVLSGERGRAVRSTTSVPSRRVPATSPAPSGGGVALSGVPSSPHDRRVRISTILGAKGEATIKDISEIITDVSEKTIQRELNAMIEEKLVIRQGERRWSKYSLLT